MEASAMTLDRWLAIVGVIVALVGLYYAWFFYRKTVTDKVLTLGYTNAIPLVLPASSLDFSYLDHPVSELSRTFVLLWNRGTSPIEREDFISPIAVLNNESLLSLDVYDKNPAADVTISPDWTISVNLLRPGEAVILKLDAREVAYRVDLAIRMKASEMSVVLRSDRALMPLAISIGLWTFCVVAFVFYFDIPRLGIEMPGVIEAVVSVLLFFGLPTLIAVVAYPIIRKLMVSITPPIVWRFFEMKTAASRAHAAWKSLVNQLSRIELN
jgi:hypothetical protein